MKSTLFLVFALLLLHSAPKLVTVAEAQLQANRANICINNRNGRLVLRRACRGANLTLLNQARLEELSSQGPTGPRGPAGMQGSQGPQGVPGVISHVIEQANFTATAMLVVGGFSNGTATCPENHVATGGSCQGHPSFEPYSTNFPTSSSFTCSFRKREAVGDTQLTAKVSCIELAQ